MPADVLPPVPNGVAQKAPYSPVVMTFGAEGFFGYGPSTSPSECDTDQDGLGTEKVKPFGPEAMWWSTYEEEDLPEKKDIDSSIIRQQLIDRHAKWQDPVIQKIIHGEMDIQSKIPTWVTPKLPNWSRDGMILIGDAAHGKSTHNCYPFAARNIAKQPQGSLQHQVKAHLKPSKTLKLSLYYCRIILQMQINLSRGSHQMPLPKEMRYVVQGHNSVL